MKAGNTSSFQNFEEYISTDQSAQGFPDARPSPVIRLIVMWDLLYFHMTVIPFIRR